MACERLTEEATERTVEEFGAAARSIRDLIDPYGAQGTIPRTAREARIPYQRRPAAEEVSAGGVRCTSPCTCTLGVLSRKYLGAHG